MTADCAGTSAPYYHVRVELDDAGIHSAHCPSPDEFGGYCKHTVAPLITYIHHPKKFAVRLPAADLLRDLSREDLLALLTKLIERQSELGDWILAALATPTTNKKAKSRAKIVNVNVYRRQVRNILHSLDGIRASEAYWHVGGLADDSRGVQESTMQFLEHGDAETELEILLILLDEAGSGIEYIDNSNGELGGFLNDLGQPLAEAILSLEWSVVEREKLIQRLDKLARHLDNYGLGDAIPLALEAATDGWGDAPVRSHTLGRDADEDWEEDDKRDDDEDENEFDEAYSPDWQPESICDLTEAKLNVLQRQDKTDEYLALCQKAGYLLRYALKLCDLGRIAEVIPFAQKHLTTANEALAVAEILRALKHLDAIALGERGLQLAPPKARLGNWLGPIEKSHGRVAKTFTGFIATFAEQPSLEMYIILKRLAEPTCEKIRAQVMGALKQSRDDQALVEVYLFEQEWDEAIKIADLRDTWYVVTQTVADGVIAHRPEWVIRHRMQEAEELIGKTQSKYYRHAVEWLARARRAWAQLNQMQQWNKFLDALKEKYKRRPALQEQLRGL